MRLIPIDCRSCGHSNQLPAVREMAFFRCEKCRQLTKLSLTHRLVFMREADHRYPAPTYVRADRRSGLGW